MHDSIRTMVTFPLPFTLYPLLNKLIFLSPRRVSPFLAWGDFHARSRFARSTVPEEKWGTTRSLAGRWNTISDGVTQPPFRLNKHIERTLLSSDYS